MSSVLAHRPLLFVAGVVLTACAGGSDTPPPHAPMLQAVHAAEAEAVPASLPLPERVPPPPNNAVPMPPPAPGLPPSVPGGQTVAADTAAVAARRIGEEQRPQLAYSVLLRGLQSLQDLAFLPDGSLLYTERAQGLSMRRPDGKAVRLFAPKDLAVRSGGLYGLAIDPEFATNRFVYVFMTSDAHGRPDHRVVRLTLDAAGTITQRRDIVTGIAPSATQNNVDSTPSNPHVGGRLRFGPDGYLYVAVGDLLDAAAPQSPTRLGGKVLRVDRNGQPAPSNVSPAGFDARIYAYGMRNPQGLAFRPGTRMVYAFEDGAGSDEITVLRAGGNAGWDPRCSNLRQSEVVKTPAEASGYCGIAQPERHRPLAAMTDLSRFPDAMRPVWTNLNRAQGMAGAEFLVGAQWKAWNGALAVAFADGRRIDILQLDVAGGVSGYTSILVREKLRWRTLAHAPDGALYAGADGKPGSDEIWRISAR